MKMTEIQIINSERKNLGHILLPVGALLAVSPWVSSAGALVLGLLLSLAFGNPYATQMKSWTSRLLACSVMGLGAGMNLAVIGQVGYRGIGYTVIGIALTFLLGSLFGKLLKVEKNTSLLITVGTAICGGSAIAAVASVIRAKNHEVSVSLGTVFLLNATALFIFPWIGHQLQLEQTQFGLWSALAIHDTSSVVGATLQYGAQALEIGTTVKLARALWIIPVAAFIGFVRSRKKVSAGAQGSAVKTPVKRPWFILGFILAAAIVTWIPSLAPLGHEVESIAKKLMILTLFLIGAGLTREAVKSVGIKPFVQGVALWFVSASVSLSAVYFAWIH
jgi:uncharacterized integral membrane protein (TIGR00698 family)